MTAPGHAELNEVFMVIGLAFTIYGAFQNYFHSSGTLQGLSHSPLHTHSCMAASVAYSKLRVREPYRHPVEKLHLSTVTEANRTHVQICVKDIHHYQNKLST